MRPQDHPLLRYTDHVWQWFRELHQSRGRNGFGVVPLSWADKNGWSVATGRDPKLWEWQLIADLDMAYLEGQGQ